MLKDLLGCGTRRHQMKNVSDLLRTPMPKWARSKNHTRAISPKMAPKSGPKNEPKNDPKMTPKMTQT